MRRSSAPSQRSLIIGGTAGSKDGDGSENRSAADSIMYKRNAASVASGRCVVSREPLTNWLIVPQGRPVSTNFVSPCDQRSEEAERLRKVKSLGVRRSTNFIKGGARFRRPDMALMDLTNIMDGAPEVDNAPPAPVEEVKEEERTWEPLVLWQGEVEKAEGEMALHTVQVADQLCKVLRPHQREGVQFVFECVTGARDFEGNGCILADDMGLGKTLQSIVVLHTLLKNGFKPGERIVRKAIVVTPTSLVKNWHKEIEKWVGNDADIGVIAITDSGKSIDYRIREFLNRASNRILIISYETFRGHIKTFPKGCDNCCDLLICDEAHRLKNAETATNQTLAALSCRRRILLSGTPLQNDLEEFYAMVDFTNPGILGTPNEFRRNVVRHILTGREPDATDAQVAKAQECQCEMSNLVNEFILRRTNTLNAQHLPPKLVQVVCCRLTDVQKSVYKHLLSSKEIRHIFEGKQTNILSNIGALQKLCNHPLLLQEAAGGSSTRGNNPSAGMKAYQAQTAAAGGGLSDEIAHLLPPSIRMRGQTAPVQPELSGKMLVLERLMYQMRRSGTERIVIVSNYTQTLDVVGSLCRERNWPVTRLDGSTTVARRQKLVDAFNDPHSNSFAFLLSSKAGGCGINLIGANRLVLFDPDWNPAVDKQAAARVWREGQKRRCFIYRFVSTGTIEEKIFMRQLSKEGLQSIVDDKEEVNSLSSKDLRKLFMYDEGTLSDTHNKLACSRCPIEAIRSGQHKSNEAAQAFNRAQAAEVATLVVTLSEAVGMEAISTGVQEILLALPEGSEDPCLFSLEAVLEKLSSGGFASLPAFTKDMRRMLRNTERAAAEGSPLKSEVQKLMAMFETEWRRAAPRLLTLRDTEEQGEGAMEQEGEKASQEQEGPKEGEGDRGETEGEGAEKVAFQPQVGMPLEEDMNNWSHHWSVDTVDDDMLREALEDHGDVISFIFGLEVTWDLLQKFPPPEVKPREKKSTGVKKKLSLAKGTGDSEDDEDGEGGQGSSDEEADLAPKKPAARGKGKAAATGGRGRGRGRGGAVGGASGRGAEAKKKVVLQSESEMSATDSDKDEGSLGGGSGTSSEEEAVVAKRRPVAGRRKAAEAASAMAMVQAQNDWVSDTESDTSEDEQPRRKVVKPKVQAPKEAVAQAPQADEVIEIPSSSDDDQDAGPQKRVSVPPPTTTDDTGAQEDDADEDEIEMHWDASMMLGGDDAGESDEAALGLQAPISSPPLVNADDGSGSQRTAQKRGLSSTSPATRSCGSGSKSAKWECPRCTYHNAVSRSSCAACDARAPAASKRRMVEDDDDEGDD